MNLAKILDVELHMEHFLAMHTQWQDVHGFLKQNESLFLKKKKKYSMRLQNLSYCGIMAKNWFSLWKDRTFDWIVGEKKILSNVQLTENCVFNISNLSEHNLKIPDKVNVIN